MKNFEPNIVAFVCHWCAYGGADQAGSQKLEYPANVKLIRVMCSGRIDPQMVMEAFIQGADGVMILGCHPGDCHYRSGNLKMQKRIPGFQALLPRLGIEPARCLQDWVAASEGKKFQTLAAQMTETIRQLGPLSLGRKSPQEAGA